MPRRSLEEIIASDPRFANVDINKARANYRDAMAERNAKELPEVVVTAKPSKKNTKKDKRKALEETRRMNRISPEDAIQIINTIEQNKKEEKRDKELANISPQQLKTRRSLEEADFRTSQTAPSGANVMEHVVSPIMNLYMPSQWVGAAFDAAQGERGFWEGLGRGNSGFVTDKFAEEHPYLAMGVNALGDYASYATMLKSATAVNDVTKDIYLGKKVFNEPGTYTRGIGTTKAGLQDLVESGVVRGNPRGTEVTAHDFAKMFRKNRYNFADIIRDTKIKGIENRFFSRTLSEKEFNAIKSASKNYTKKSFKNNNDNIEFVEEIADPLYKYKDYDDYINQINKTIGEVKDTKFKIQSKLFDLDDSESLKVNKDSNIPVNKRFAANSDYNVDGDPLAYFYDDGRNPFTKGYDYAGSRYGLKINNIEDYSPFIHDYHLHPSLKYSPKFLDNNVEIYKRLPLGFVKKLNKDKLLRSYDYTRPRHLNNIIRNYGEMLMYASKGASTFNTIKENEINTLRYNPKIIAQQLIYPFTRKNLKNHIRKNVMNYFNYNGLVSYYPLEYPISNAPFNSIRAGLYHDFGELAPYVRDIKPNDLHYTWAVLKGNNPNIKVIDSPYYGNIENIENIRNLGRNGTLDTGLFPVGDKYAYDAGGHFERFTLDDFYRESDVNAYNTKRYTKKWLKNDSKTKNISKFLLKQLDKRFDEYIYAPKKTKLEHKRKLDFLKDDIYGIDFTLDKYNSIKTIKNIDNLLKDKNSINYIISNANRKQFDTFELISKQNAGIKLNKREKAFLKHNK